MARVSDEVIISAMLSNPTKRDAAKACGISESRLYARLKKPDLIAKYNEARRSILEDNSARIQQHVGAAIETMVTLTKTAKNEQTRLNAAEAVVRTSLKLTELVDILTRLEQLEQLQERQ